MKDWKKKKFAYSGSNIEYIGFHWKTFAATSENGWEIRKLTYSGSDITDIQKSEGKWDDRATLF